MAHFDSLDAIPDGKLREKVIDALEDDNEQRARRRESKRGSARGKSLPDGQAAPARTPTLKPLTITIPCEAWSLNREREAPPYVRMAHTKAVKLAVLALLPRDVGRFEVPVEIEATPVGVKHDAGNSIPTIKAAIDQLVGSGVLTDDRGCFVTRLILNAPEPGEKSVRLVVRPARET